MPEDSDREGRPQPAVEHEREGTQGTPQQRHLHRHPTFLHFSAPSPAKKAPRQAREISPLAQALAIRERKIHIVGSPELKLQGTPVYLDVEGLPDRDFYYLIGLRIGIGES